MTLIPLAFIAIELTRTNERERERREAVVVNSVFSGTRKSPLEHASLSLHLVHSVQFSSVGGLLMMRCYASLID